MIATFRETAKSLQDLKYANQIVKKTMGEALWYWTKYLILFFVVACVLGIAALVYYTPQLPKLAAGNLPDLTLTIKNGKATANVPQPFVRGDENFSFIIDTKGEATELDKFKTGVLLTEDRLIIKTETETRTVELKDIQDFSASKATVIHWLKSHQLNILFLGMVAVVLVAALGGAFYWGWNMLGMAIWSILLLLIAKIFKKKLDYGGALKTVLYASVYSLLIHILSFFFPSQFFGLVALAVFLFYSVAWVYNLNTGKKINTTKK